MQTLPGTPRKPDLRGQPGTIVQAHVPTQCDLFVDEDVALPLREPVLALFLARAVPADEWRLDNHDGLRRLSRVDVVELFSVVVMCDLAVVIRSRPRVVEPIPNERVRRVVRRSIRVRLDGSDRRTRVPIMQAPSVGTLRPDEHEIRQIATERGTHAADIHVIGV